MVNSRESVPERHRPRHCGARPGAAARGPPNPFRGLATAMLALAVCAGGPAEAAERLDRQRPHYEFSAGGETREPGATARVEIDAAIPLRPDAAPGSALFLQPGLVLSRGPEERSLYGGSLGIVYRFEGAGGIVGVNAFHDLNRISGPGRAMTHRQASLGADYQSGRSRIGANWYITW